jgi:hypothetical protein
MGGGKTHLLVGFGLLAKHAGLRKKYCGGMLHASAFKTAHVPRKILRRPHFLTLRVQMR